MGDNYKIQKLVNARNAIISFPKDERLVVKSILIGTKKVYQSSYSPHPTNARVLISNGFSSVDYAFGVDIENTSNISMHISISMTKIDKRGYTLLDHASLSEVVRPGTKKQIWYNLYNAFYNPYFKSFNKLKEWRITEISISPSDNYSMITSSGQSSIKVNKSLYEIFEKSKKTLLPVKEGSSIIKIAIIIFIALVLLKACFFHDM